MSRRAGRAPAHQIAVRQQREDAIGKYTGIVAEHNKLKMFSDWEQSSTRKMQHNEVFQQMDSVQARHDEVLVHRRKRLAALLLADRERHERMLAQLSETEDQRRERLMANARELRDQREELRKQEAEKLKGLAFRNQSVVIREAESKAKVLNVAAQRKAQLDEAAEIKRRKQEEDAIFNELWEEQRLEKIKRARKDLEARHKRLTDTRHNLAVQKDAAAQKKQQEIEEMAREDAAYLEKVREGLRIDAQAEADRRAKQRKIAAETREMNDRINEEKDKERQALRAEDERNLQEILEEIKVQEEAEKQRKVEVRVEAINQMKFVEAQMNAAAESETALDRLWQEENDKEWNKRESRWKDEQDRRDALLRQVFQERKNQVLSIRQREEEEAERKRREREEVIQNIQTLSSSDTGDARARREKARQVQQFQALQVQDRLERRAKERAELTDELAYAMNENDEYERQLNAELAKLEANRPAEFSHIKLSSSKKRI
jgi:cilia- and flagella-associated protein 53